MQPKCSLPTIEICKSLTLHHPHTETWVELEKTWITLCYLCKYIMNKKKPSCKHFSCVYLIWRCKKSVQVLLLVFYNCYSLDDIFFKWFPSLNSLMANYCGNLLYDIMVLPRLKTLWWPVEDIHCLAFNGIQTMAIILHFLLYVNEILHD